jgi:hypothetical protein
MAGCNAKHDNLQDNPLRLSFVFIPSFLVLLDDLLTLAKFRALLARRWREED